MKNKLNYLRTIMAIRQKSVPSGKGVIVFIFKVLLSYLIPGIVIGFLFALFQPIGSLLNSPYLIAFIIVSVGGVLFSLWISHVLSSSTKLYTADYENALEKDLASVNYQNASMDEVTNKMKDILRKNIESSSMNVYILTSQNELETAYSSNKLSLTIPVNNPIFDHLINNNINVVIYQQIEKDGSYLYPYGSPIL